MQKQDEKKVPEAGRENWKAEDLVKESVNEDSDETVRKVLRGDEEKGNPDYDGTCSRESQVHQHATCMDIHCAER